MKTKIDYKSKKAIIIAIILLALIVISGFAISMFLKGNNQSEAIGENTIGNTINNNVNQNTPTNNQGTENTNRDDNKNNTATDTENGDNTNNNNQENVDNNVGTNNNNTGNVNNNTGDVPNREFVTERVEIIPERVIAERYLVSWEPTQFDTLMDGKISLEKANIEAKKTVAKITENGLIESPESVKVGEVLQYTITLTNTNSKVNGVVNVIDTIPAGTEFISATGANLKTTPKEFKNPNEVTKLEWKNIKVKAGSEVTLIVKVKVVAKSNNEDTAVVQNVAIIYDGTGKEEVPSEETKVANITAVKTSKIIYNQEKPHEHIIENGVEPLHEQDIIEYTITLTNVGQAEGIVKVSDTVPEGTTLINDGVVTVVDKNGEKTYTIQELIEGIDVTVEGIKEANSEKIPGTATVMFKVIVNSFEENTKTIINDQAKVDGNSTNTTEDEAEKVYIDINATKIWNDDNNKIGIRPESIELTLVQDGVETQNKLTANAENNWTVEFANLNKYTIEGNEIVYTIKEEQVANYKAPEYSQDGLTVTNTIDYLSIKTSKTATKIWNDDNNKIGIRPESIELTLVQDGVETENKLTANAGNNWTVEFANLNKYTIEGDEIVYTIKETQVANYKAPEYSKDGLTVTNTIDYLSIKTSKTATKIWNDDNNKIGIRPESIELTLVQDGVETQNKLTVNAGNNWTVEFANLNKYTIEGNEIVYTIKEEQVANYKAPEYSKDGLTVTNTIDYTSFTISKTITKIWEDNSDLYSTRPESVVLTFNGSEYTLTANNDEDKATLDQWSITINNLPKYDAQGNEITYTATEQNVPEGYTKVTEEGTTVVNRANIIVEKSAYKANSDGTIGNEATETDIFKANEIVYYKLKFKNAGNEVINTKTLTDILPLRLNLLEIDGIAIAENTENGKDNNGYTWTLSKNENGNTVISWILTNIPEGAQKELTIKAQVVAEAEYKDLCQKTGETTNYTAKIFVRKDGKVPYEGSGTSYGTQYYSSSLGTVYLTSSELFYDTEANLKNDDLYYLIKNNNTITSMISKGISREQLVNKLQENGITLATDEVVVWYVIKSEYNGYHIDGVIRKISDLTSITNEVYMDNAKQDEVTIKLQDIEIGQRGTVTVQGTTSTTATVSTPMDVVFILDTSGSMEDSLSSNNQQNTNKVTSMVNAVNTTIQTIMSKNSNSRIGVVGFSDSASQIIALGNYSSHTGNYLTLGTSGSGKHKSYYIQSNVTSNSSRTITGGTNTQAGIKLGAEMLTANGLNRSFETTVNGVTVTGTRTPVIILVTDGEPTYYYPNQTATGNRQGTGGSSNQNYYYWTLRTAKYYKEQVKTKYYGTTEQQAKMFTIGIGLDSTLATTMLKPNQTNVDVCKNSSEGTEERKLYNLLNSSGTPYTYDYADGTATGALTETDIQDFLNTSINSSSSSVVIRSITTEESAERKVSLTDIDTTKAFSLKIIGESTLEYNTLTDAISAGYVKQDSGEYYVDLSNIARETTVNISYWQQ